MPSGSEQFRVITLCILGPKTIIKNIQVRVFCAPVHWVAGALVQHGAVLVTLGGGRDGDRRSENRTQKLGEMCLYFYLVSFIMYLKDITVSL